MRKIRRFAVAGAACALLAAGTITALTMTARADTFKLASCVAANGIDQCSMSATIGSPGGADLVLTTVPGALSVQLNWTTQCSATGSAPWTGATGGGIYAAPATVPVASSLPHVSACDLTVTATFPSSLVRGEVDIDVPVGQTVAASGALVTGPAGRCLTAAGGKLAARVKVVASACLAGEPSQSWTLSGGALRLHGGLCLNAKGRAGAGSGLILWRCDASANESWLYRTASHEYQLKAHGYQLCLTVPGKTVPGKTVRNGTPLVVAACKGTADQRWTLPRA